MKKIYSKFQNFSLNFVNIFSGIVFLLFFVTSIILTMRIPNNEFIEIVFNYTWIIFLAIKIFILYFIIKFREKINANYFFIALAIAYLIIGFYIVFRINATLRADAALVWRGAVDFNNGKFTLFEKGHYFNYYPYQLGLLHYERLIMSILGTSSRILFAFNLIQVIFINLALYKIVDLLGNKNHLLNILTIYLGFAFLPQLFFITFAYGLIAGLFFAIWSIYFLLRYEKTRKITDVLISAVLIALASLIRNNYMILFIAMAIYLLMFNYKEYKKLAVLFLVSFLILNKLFTFGINKMTENRTNHKIEAGAPKNLWIAMGTDPDNWHSGPGWYNGYGLNTLKKVNFDYEKAKELGNEKIKENFSYFLKNPIKAFVFFGSKITSTWQEPTFQSFWSGPHDVYDQVVKDKILSSLYNQKTLYTLNFNMMKANLVLIYALCAVYLLKMRNKKTSIFVLYFLGGFVFHIFWETKAQYVYPYVFLMLPVVALSIENLYKKFEYIK